jgi:hypothetical protein
MDDPINRIHAILVGADQLAEWISEYFGIGTDCYAFNLMRVKCNNVSLDDFEEFNEETSTDLARFLTAKFSGE